MKLNIKNMKSTGLFGAFCCTILFFASCSSEQITDDNGNNIQTESGLKLNISKSVFLDTETTESRVTNEGLNTTFSEGDVIGVLVTHNKKNLNLPYKYENGTWTFDSSKGKEFFIKTQAGSLDYVIYYPYSAAADGKTTKDELLEAMPIKEDQSTEENYLASDVLYSEVSTEGTTIVTQLQHARALFSYVSKAKSQTTLSEEIEFDLPELDIQFFDNNDKELKVYKTSEGEYRYIIPASVQGNSISWIYNYKEKVYGDVKDLSQLQENNKYSRIEYVNIGVYDESKAKVGDFYCSSSDNKGYLLPKEYDIAASGHKCIGIVFHVGAGDGDNQNDYSSTKIAENGIKGYVVALNDAGNLQWAKSNEIGINAITEKDRTKWNAFKDLSIVKGQTLDNFPAFSNCVNFSVSSTVESSGWYLPSYAQLDEIFKSKNILKETINKLSDSQFFKEDWYWSSTQSSNANQQALMYYMKDNGGSYDWDKMYGYNVRPVLTF